MKLTLHALILTAAIALFGVAFGGPAAAGDAQMKLPRETLAADSQSNFAQGNQLLHNSGSSQTEMQQASEKLEKLGAHCFARRPEKQQGFYETKFHGPDKVPPMGSTEAPAPPPVY